MNDEDPISVNCPKKKQKTLEQPKSLRVFVRQPSVSWLEPIKLKNTGSFINYIIKYMKIVITLPLYILP